MLKRRAPFIIVAAAALAATLAYAQSDFQSFMQQQMNEFQEFRDERDREFTSYLEQQWKEFQAFAGEEFDTVPKPKTIPTAPAAPPEPPEEPSKPVVIPPAPKPEPKPEPTIAPPAPKPEPRPQPDIAPTPKPKPMTPPPPPSRPKGLTVSFDFYGTTVIVPYTNEMKSLRVESIANTAIADAWKTLAKTAYEPTVEALAKAQKTLRLNDWGLYLLSNGFGKELFGADDNRVVVLTWFVMNKAGFDSRIAASGKDVLLLMPATVPVYGVPYLTFDGTRYYALSAYLSGRTPNRLFTYEDSYPGADKRVEFRVATAPAFIPVPKKRTLRFSYAGTPHEIPVAFDGEVVSYFNRYPQAHIVTFFGAEPSPEASASLVNTLAPLIEGKSEREAVNILLRFVQTSFRYATDDEQFGREKYLLPDETLNYPASDCEDRSVLFAWLVKRLVGLEVVGLDYPGHIATAVRFSTEVPGDSVRVDGKTYVISDPTYVNADVGMTMPDYARTTPKIIRF